MSSSRKNILIICLSILVAFAPIPSLVANATVNKDEPCSMGKTTRHESEVHSRVEKATSPDHCKTCDQSNTTCQQCDCNLTGCVLSKVQQNSGPVKIPQSPVNHQTVSYFINSPPHSQFDTPLLRPPIQLYS